MAIDSLSELRAFVAIVDAGSFTAAARQLGLTVNAMSRRLQRLEAAVGTRLVERTTRRSSPTDAGRRLREHAGPILDALLEAESALDAAHTSAGGHVTVALPATVAGRPFLTRLRSLMSAHPELTIELRVGAPQLPGQSGVDLAVVVGDVRDTLGLVGRRIGTHRWALAASVDYVRARGAPARPADLARHACLRFRGDVPQRTWTLSGPRGKRVVVNVGGAVECDDSRVLGDAMYAGLGIGIRPEAEVAEAVARGELVHVLPEWRFGELPTHLLTTPGRRGLRRIVLVSEAIIESVRRLR